MQLKSFLQHEFRLGHRAFKGVNQKDNAVDHLEHALHLAAEVGVAGGVDDIDLHALVGDGGIFRKDCDTALALDIVTVHHALLHDLAGAEHAALLQKLVHKGRLTVVDMRNDRYIPDVISFHGCQ